MDLRAEDLSRVFAILLGGDPGDLPEALGPLYRHDDRTELVVVMPIFNKQGLLTAEGSGPVEVSSGDTSREGALRRPSMTAGDVVLPGAKQKKNTVAKPKASLDASPALVDTSPFAGEEDEGEARGAASLALVV
ncbi:hypothetical protein D1007_21002 [Hordeum vulgare]|nr:hypothetical protein D1007_21002 [Hordeum vulgare]